VSRGPIVSRRDLIRSSAALALASVQVATAVAASGALDVAVIGGGVAGCHAAWRLQSAAPGSKVAVFEASARIGGRLHSFRFPEAPHAVAELGGMRFLSGHVHVERLAGHLGLAKKTFVNAGAANLLNLRGRSLRYDAVGGPDGSFSYPLSSEVQRAGPEALLARAANGIVPGGAHLAPEAWAPIRRDFRLQGRLLRDWSLRTVMATALSFEEMRFLAAASGYDQMVDGPNAADMLALMLAHDMPGETVNTLVEGYQSLPLALAERLAAAGGAVWRGHRLVALVPDADGSAPGFRLDFATASGRISVFARKVVLAMGRTGIEAVRSPLVDQAATKALVASVAPWPMAKMFLVYPRPWWRRLGIEAGRTVTDMPARQLWYFGTEDDTPGGTPRDTNSLLMSYCDAASVSYWQALAETPLDAGFATVAPDGLLARELHRQVKLVHGLDDLPAPIAACYQDWTVAPYGGAVHHWQVGVESDDAMAAILKPVRGLDIFVCGEAWSRHQGWAEGALETAEAMLVDHFGLPTPEWLGR
jgi:monoamine oxidase